MVDNVKSLDKCPIKAYEEWAREAAENGMFVNRGTIGAEDCPSQKALAKAALEFHAAGLSKDAVVLTFD